MTDKEVLDKCVRAMGDELGQLYYELRTELVSLHLKWRECLGLFGVGQERVILLNKTAPFFFGMIEKVLFEDIILHLARLTDPPEIRKQRNLTIEILPELIPPKFKDDFDRRLQAVRDSCGFVRRWRNKWVAHADLNMKRNPQKLPPATREKVERVLEAMRDLMNSLARYYGLPETTYDLGTGEPGGADSLANYLAKGFHAERRQ